VFDLLSQNHPIIMGILNTTPDSFSDGGKFTAVEAAVAHAMKMVEEGAEIIDVGGESTRPGAAEVSAEDEIQRVVPIIKAIRQLSDVVISVDTSKPEVMKAAVKAGANLINDVNGLRATGAVELCAELSVPVCIMHMQGKPRTMQTDPQYGDVVEDIISFLAGRIKDCVKAGVDRDNIIVDPGFGFGKTLEHNLQLLNRLDEFQKLGVPVLAGISRKSMLGAILDESDAEKRLHASVAAVVLAWTRGAKIFRVHDVKPTADALKVCFAMAGVED